MAQETSGMRKYREAQDWVAESYAVAMATQSYEAWAAWRRDTDIRMKRADALSDAEYDQIMQEGRA